MIELGWKRALSGLGHNLDRDLGLAYNGHLNRDHRKIGQLRLNG